MSIITKSLITKSNPIPMQSGNRLTFTNANTSAQNKNGYLEYYNNIVWLRAAIQTIADAIAQSTWRLYKKKDGGDREEVTGAHPLKELLNHPNPFQSGHDFLAQHQTFVELIGESYQIKQTDMGTKELWLPIPSYMRAVPDQKKYISEYIYERGADIRHYKPEEVIAFLESNPLDPLSGIGRAQSAGIDIESLNMMSQYNKYFFYWDASSGTTITYPLEANITPDELNRLAEQWNAGHRGYGRAHRAAILTQGATVNNAGVGQKDMDFVNLDKSLREKILGAFGLSYASIGGTESVNRANADAQILNFARWVMVPRLTKLREKWNMSLVPDFGDDLELDYDSPVPEDTAAMAGVIDGHVKSGIMSIEEARQELDWGDIDPDEHFMIPINFSIKTGDEILNPPPEPVMPAAPFGKPANPNANPNEQTPPTKALITALKEFRQSLEKHDN